MLDVGQMGFNEGLRGGNGKGRFWVGYVVEMERFGVDVEGAFDGCVGSNVVGGEKAVLGDGGCLVEARVASKMKSVCFNEDGVNTRSSVRCGPRIGIGVGVSSKGGSFEGAFAGGVESEAVEPLVCNECLLKRGDSVGVLIEVGEEDSGPGGRVAWNSRTAVIVALLRMRRCWSEEAPEKP